MWLDRVKAELGDDLEVNWRSFSLEQQNSKEGPEWKAWEQGSDYESRGLLALKAGVAARKQGDELQWKFTLALLKARHEDKADVRVMETIASVAAEAGLDVDQLKSDMDDSETISTVAREHEQAAEQGIFGTPTYVFEGAKPAFLKMFTPPEEETMDVWEGVTRLSTSTVGFGELKRPQPPWPRDVFDDK